MIISVDFDGTCVTHEYPKTGKDIGAEIVLKALTDAGHKVICTTMRSDGDTKRHGVDTVNNAKKWFKEKDIPLYGFNDNPIQKEWSDSRKIYANTYIDDQFLGVPLRYNEMYSRRVFVDWFLVSIILYQQGWLEPNKAKTILSELSDKYPDIYSKNKKNKQL